MATEISPLMLHSLDATIESLANEFRGVFSRETVAKYVEDSYGLLGDRPSVGPNFMPVLIERFARDRLRAVAQTHGKVEKMLPEVLFVCEHNAGRSQMAAALTHRLSDGRVVVRSAGSNPEELINPVVVEAMEEIGVDISMEFPKPLTDEVVRASDAVITMGCGDACPVYPGKRYEDWEVADPAGQPLDVVRQIRDDIRERVESLLQELLPDSPDQAVGR